MSKKKFLYVLAEEDGRSRTVINGVVTSTSQVKPLPQAPDGNQEISIGWERSFLYWGNIRNFSLPLGFVMTAATILRNDWYKFNIDRKLFLIILRLTYEFTVSTYKEYYKLYYKGELDFSTIDDAKGDHRVNINIMEGGLQKLLKANENTKFDIPFDEDAQNVLMDGMYINGNFRWFIPASPEGPLVYPGVYLLTNDNPIPGLAIFTVQEEPVGAGPGDEITAYFALATQNIPNVRFQATFLNVQLGSSMPFFEAELYTWNTVTQTFRIIKNFNSNDYVEGQTVTMDETFDLFAGERLLFSKSFGFDESKMSLTAKSKPLPGYIKMFTLYELGRKIVEKLTGSAGNFSSVFLQTINIGLSSGDGVRGLAGAGVKISWKDYFAIVDIYTKAGMQITDKIVIENRELYFTPESLANPAIELGEVKNLSITPAIEFMGTSIKVGHAEQQVDDTNGKYDFNGFQIWNTPVKRIADKEIDLQAPSKAGPFEIEQTRANYEGKTTTDRESDNNIFALAVLPDDALNGFDALASFAADGTPFAPGEPVIYLDTNLPLLAAGQRVNVTGSASNDGQYTVKIAAAWFFGQVVVLNEPVTDENNVNIHIEIVNGKFYTLDRTPSVDVLYDPDLDQDTKDSIYNVPLSPRRILQTHANWLAGALYGYAPAALTFESANRNKLLVSDGVAEVAPMPIATMPAPMFLPFWAEFDTLAPVDLVEILKANSNPVFAFIHESVRYTGFLWKAGIAPNMLEEQTFKLLFCPENDILSLIS